MQQITETTAREMTECPKCHKPKALGLVVCWSCWKEYKHFTGTLTDFLEAETMNSMFELWAQFEKNGAVKVYEVFAETFDDACTKLINKYPSVYKITNPNLYSGVI